MCWSVPTRRLFLAGMTVLATPAAQYRFMVDLASRLANRVQLTTDGLKYHTTAVEGGFGWGNSTTRC